MKNASDYFWFKGFRFRIGPFLLLQLLFSISCQCFVSVVHVSFFSKCLFLSLLSFHVHIIYVCPLMSPTSNLDNHNILIIVWNPQTICQEAASHISWYCEEHTPTDTHPTPRPLVGRASRNVFRTTNTNLALSVVEAGECSWLSLCGKPFFKVLPSNLRNESCHFFEWVELMTCSIIR